MFMSFKCCNNNGQPSGNRICINMRKIENIVEMGQWTAMPNPHELPDYFELEGPPMARPRRPNRPVARAHVPDAFVVTPNCVQIFTAQQSYSVIANFEELTKTLESLNDMFEAT